MFIRARLNLTISYTLMIMLISGVVSGLFYYHATRVIDQQIVRIEQRIKHEQQMGMPTFRRHLPARFFLQDAQTAKQQILWHLVWINGIIVLVCAAAGYWLSGKTLRPIQKAMEKQKQFVANASHDLRTPLTALKTALEVNIADKKVNTYAKKLMRENLGDVQTLERLSTQLLELARLDQLTDQPVSKTVVLLDIFALMAQQFETHLKQKHLKLKQRVTPNSLTLQVDPEQLEKVLRILLDNATKYTPQKGTIYLTAEQKKDTVMIVVKDSGIGIAKKDLPNIFNRFYQADAARQQPETNGYGLGLAIAKEIVGQLGGKIEVRSKLGKGTTFTITF